MSIPPSTNIPLHDDTESQRVRRDESNPAPSVQSQINLARSASKISIEREKRKKTRHQRSQNLPNPMSPLRRIKFNLFLCASQQNGAPQLVLSFPLILPSQSTPPRLTSLQASSKSPTARHTRQHPSLLTSSTLKGSLYAHSLTTLVPARARWHSTWNTDASCASSAATFAAGERATEWSCRWLRRYERAVSINLQV